MSEIIKYTYIAYSTIHSSVYSVANLKVALELGNSDTQNFESEPTNQHFRDFTLMILLPRANSATICIISESILSEGTRHPQAYLDLYV